MRPRAHLHRTHKRDDGYELLCDVVLVRRRPPYLAFLLLSVLSLTVSACGSSGGGQATAVRAARLARWGIASHIQRVLDLSSPRRNGALVVATAGRLALLKPGGVLQSFATGPAGYSRPRGED